MADVVSRRKAVRNGDGTIDVIETGVKARNVVNWGDLPEGTALADSTAVLVLNNGAAIRCTLGELKTYLATQGPAGKSAFDAAVSGGYEGTEWAFNTKLNGLLNGYMSGVVLTDAQMISSDNGGFFFSAQNRDIRAAGLVQHTVVSPGEPSHTVTEEVLRPVKVAAPTDDNHAATKAFVEAAIADLRAELTGS